MAKQNVFFISDTHFSHKSVLYYNKNRRENACISIEELNSDDKQAIIDKYDNWLIYKWNTTIGKKDIIYILGDFCLGNKERTEKILQKLNGDKFLIRGNHDKSCNGLERYFKYVGDIKEIKFSHDLYPFIKEGETFCIECCHYPMVSWNRRTYGSCHIHGHVHGSLDVVNLESGELRVDVGLDGKLSDGEFISLEKLYNHFRNIVLSNDCENFKEYIEKLMEKQGYRA